ncbi:hypothetical protein KSS87_019889 [Heliosperma pusillum]|nr:hypothetical protein KSS87_019889 [Heliosperma pusillum]
MSKLGVYAEDEPARQLLKKEEPGSNWDDEDIDDDDVKESWEEEDEPKPAPVPVKAPEKPAKKAGSKENGKKEKVEVAIEAEAPLDPVAEKLRQQRLVEEADFKSTKALFAKKGDDKTLDNFIPKSEGDFSEYADLVAHKLRPYEKSFHYIGLLKAVIRLSMASLTAADAKDVASSVAAIANEKLKAEKEAMAGKKKAGAKKKQLHVGKPDDDVAIAAYDDAGEYDFM